MAADSDSSGLSSLSDLEEDLPTDRLDETQPDPLDEDQPDRLDEAQPDLEEAHPTDLIDEAQPDLEEDIPIDLIDEAYMWYPTDLPPFIQTNLDPTIKPGDKHHVIPKTNNGSFPSVKSTKRVELVCRAWKDNPNDRFWTYDHSNTRYIVKAFQTNALPEDVPKISYHVWRGPTRPFQKTRVAYDADKRLYPSQPDEKTNWQESAPTNTNRPRREKAVLPIFGSTDSNRVFRTKAEAVEDLEDQRKQSKSKRTGASDPRKAAYPGHYSAGMDDDDDEELTKPSSHSAKPDTKMYSCPGASSAFPHQLTSPRPHLAEDDFKPKAENTKDLIHVKRSSHKDESKELGKHKGKARPYLADDFNPKAENTKDGTHAKHSSHKNESKEVDKHKNKAGPHLAEDNFKPKAETTKDSIHVKRSGHKDESKELDKRKDKAKPYSAKEDFKPQAENTKDDIHAKHFNHKNEGQKLDKHKHKAEPYLAENVLKSKAESTKDDIPVTNSSHKDKSKELDKHKAKAEAEGDRDEEFSHQEKSKEPSKRHGKTKT